MRSSVVPVVVRTAALTAVTWIGWRLGDSLDTGDEGFTWLLTVFWTLVGVAAAWGAVDGLLTGRRGEQFGSGLVVWLLVAAATGLLQSVLVGAGVRLRAALFYAVIVAVPAALTYGLAWTVGRRTGSRPRL